LLSRFDFLFIILDTPEAEHDRQVADKVLSNHRYQRRSAKASGGDDFDDPDAEVDYAALAARKDRGGAGRGGAEAKESTVYQKFDKLLHAGLIKSARARRGRGGNVGGDDEGQILSIPFMKKYLEYAKAQEPVLTSEAADFIGRAYAELRIRAVEAAARESSFPITARTLETLIRLSTAHAKARLDSEVTVADCEAVQKLLKYAIEHDTGVKGKDAKEIAERADDDEDEDEEQKSRGDDDEDQTPAVRRSPARRAGVAGRKRAARDAAEEDGADDDDDEKSAAAAPTSPSKRARTAAPPSSSSRTSSPAKRASKKKVVTSEADMEDDAAAEQEAQSSATAAAAAAPAAAAPAAPAAPTSARQAIFQKALLEQLNRLRLDSLRLSALLTHLNAAHPDAPFEQAEAQAILAQMERANAVMFRAGTIYRI
jgi:DNA replication licensing factor MCM3